MAGMRLLCPLGFEQIPTERAQLPGPLGFGQESIFSGFPERYYHMDNGTSLLSLRSFRNPHAHGVGQWLIPRVEGNGTCTPGEYASRHRSLRFRYRDPSTRLTVEAIADVHRYVNDSILRRSADPHVRSRIKNAIRLEERYGTILLK